MATRSSQDELNFPNFPFSFLALASRLPLFFTNFLSILRSPDGRRTEFGPSSDGRARTWIQGDPLMLNYLGVTHLVDNNLPLTSIRLSWQLVGCYCSYLLSRQDDGTSKYKSTGGFYRCEWSPCTSLRHVSFIPPNKYLL